MNSRSKLLRGTNVQTNTRALDNYMFDIIGRTAKEAGEALKRQREEAGRDKTRQEQRKVERISKKHSRQIVNRFESYKRRRERILAIGGIPDPQDDLERAFEDGLSRREA